MANEETVTKEVAKRPALGGCMILMLILLLLLVGWFAWSLISGSAVPGGEGKNGVDRKEKQTGALVERVPAIA